MSEQPEGHLQIPSSYNFHRERVGHTRAGSIDAQKFHLWTRNDMYRSSYAQFHSPVLPQSLRIPLNLAQHNCPATLDSSPRTEPKACTPPPTPISQKRQLTIQLSISTLLNFHQLDAIWTPRHSLTTPRMPPATNTAKLKSRPRIQPGW